MAETVLDCGHSQTENMSPFFLPATSWPALGHPLVGFSSREGVFPTPPPVLWNATGFLCGLYR